MSKILSFLSQHAAYETWPSSNLENDNPPVWKWQMPLTWKMCPATSLYIVSTLKILDFPFLLLQICSITRHTLQHLLLCELDLAIITAWKWEISDIKPYPPHWIPPSRRSRCESVRGASAGRPGLAKRTGPLKPMGGSYQCNRVLGGSPHFSKWLVEGVTSHLQLE